MLQRQMAAPEKFGTQFNLRHWSLLRSRLLWAYDHRLLRDQWEWPYVSYPTAAWLIRQGSVVLRFPSGTERFGPGTWIFPQEAEGIQRFTRGTRILSLRFEAEWSYGLPIFDRSVSYTIREEEAPELTRDAQALVDLVRAIFPELRPGRLTMEGGFDIYLRIQPVFMQWLQSYHAALSAHGVPMHSLVEFDDKVRTALHTIESRRLSTPFHEKDLAREVGYSVSQLNKAFVKQVGNTPSALWTKRRLNAAKLELGNTADSIKAIAYHLGFSLPEHFSNWFRRNTGSSPREYRKRHQPETTI